MERIGVTKTYMPQGRELNTPHNFNLPSLDRDTLIERANVITAEAQRARGAELEVLAFDLLLPATELFAHEERLLQGMEDASMVERRQLDLHETVWPLSFLTPNSPNYRDVAFSLSRRTPQENGVGRLEVVKVTTITQEAGKPRLVRHSLHSSNNGRVFSSRHESYDGYSDPNLKGKTLLAYGTVDTSTIDQERRDILELTKLALEEKPRVLVADREARLSVLS